MTVESSNQARDLDGRQAPAHSPAVTVRKRLLILDDDILMGEIISQVARLAGFETTHTTSPRHFLQQVASWNPDTVVLDLMMPEMDGVEVMAAMADLNCRASLIITSGVALRVLDAAGRTAAEQGLDLLGVLGKPFSSANLSSLLARSGQRMRQAAVGAADEQVLTAADLRQVIDQRQIRVVYQPKIRCRTGTLAGFEALARLEWNGHNISPERFIRLAEETGMICDITHLVFEQALDWLAQLASNRHDDATAGFNLSQVTLSLNISALSLANEALFGWVIQRCNELKIDRERLIFEITETSAMADPISSLVTVTRLRMQGFHLSIDDFGTGFSSMVQLVRLPFSEIKVDKSFVMNAATSSESRAIIRSIVDLGRSLGIKTTAEGIEDSEALNFLQELDCDFAQGYFISRPLPPDQLAKWFEQRESERERFRYRSLKQSGLYGSPPERRYDRITMLARKLLGMPMCMVALVGENGVWVKSGVGATVSEMRRDHTLMEYTIETDGGLVVEDALSDTRFDGDEMVVGNDSVRFYAGVPLCLPNGAKAGVLCLFDNVPRTFSPSDRNVLRQLAMMVERELVVSVQGTLDQICGLLDRSTLITQANAILNLAAKVRHSVTLLLFSVDDLGAINRKYGSRKGDDYLRRITDVILSIADDSDLVGRYRGSEIVVLKMGTSLRDVQTEFLRIREEVRECNRSIANGDEAPPLQMYVSTAHLLPDEDSDLDMAITEARRFAVGVGYA